MNRALFVLGCALASITIAGCGGAPTAYWGERDLEPEREDSAGLEAQQAELEARLGEELARPEPDCPTACSLAGRICELAERICGIAGRHAADEALAHRCADAGGRCDHGRERVAEQCTCE
jgi:hypothetical protein